MLDPWNDSSLQPPPNTAFSFCRNNSPIDLCQLAKIFNNLKKVLCRQLPLHNEGAVLSRFIYKFDRKFRTDIGYRNLKKVNTALRKYLSLNLYKDVENFTSLLQQDDDVHYVPSRQMLQYILVRIISFSLIMRRVCICAKLTAIHYLDRVKRGESHWMSLMPFALLSRIWSLGTVLLQHGCSWYSKLHPYLSHLKQKEIEFLPTSCSLPSDLEQWLDIKNIDNCGRFQWYSKRNIQIKVEFPEDDINIDTILDYVKDINEEHSDNVPLIQSNTDLRLKEPIKIPKNNEIKPVDEGQAISREYFQSFFNPTQNKKIKSVHSADLVTNKPTLFRFIANEEEYRNQTDKQSLTSHLSFMQWQSLKNSLVQLGESLSKSRKIERKFKKLWKEKCLDYM